jgi:hypothetical protein
MSVVVSGFEGILGREIRHEHYDKDKHKYLNNYMYELPKKGNK